MHKACHTCACICVCVWKINTYICWKWAQPATGVEDKGDARNGKTRWRKPARYTSHLIPSCDKGQFIKICLYIRSIQKTKMTHAAVKCICKTCQKCWHTKCCTTCEQTLQYPPFCRQNSTCISYFSEPLFAKILLLTNLVCFVGCKGHSSDKRHVFVCVCIRLKNPFISLACQWVRLADYFLLVIKVSFVVTNLSIFSSFEYFLLTPPPILQ